MLKIAQVNVNIEYNITKQLINFVKEENVHTVGICEPFYQNDKLTNIDYSFNLVNFNRPKRSKAAILVKKELKFLVDKELTDDNFVMILLDNLVIKACYLEPTLDNKIKDIKIDLNHLQKILHK